jgi:hypothetical protein
VTRRRFVFGRGDCFDVDVRPEGLGRGLRPHAAAPENLWVGLFE